MNEKSGTTDSIEDRIIKGLLEANTIITYAQSQELEICICHGCFGKGWVENTKGEIKLCPVCEGGGKLNKEKDCIEKDKEKDNLLWYPWYPCYPCYPCPSRTNDPCWPTYSIVTNCETKTDSCTNCYK